MSHSKRAQWTLLAVVISLSISMLACALFSSSSSSGKYITDAVMAKDVQGDTFEPVDITDTFSPDQKIMHAVVTLKNAPKDTAIKAVWKVVDVGDAGQNGKTLDSTVITTDGSRNVDFTYTLDGPWPAGTYQVVIYQDGNKDRTLDFTVEGEVKQAAPTTAPPQAATPVPPTAAPLPATAAPANNAGYITAAVMAQDATGNNFTPVGVTNSFPADQAIYHAVVTINNAPDGTAYRANWKVVDIGSAGNPGDSIGDYTLTASGSRNLDFTFKPNGQLPPGQYQVEISVNGALTRSLPFSVQPSAVQPTSPLVSGYIVDVTLAKDVTGDTLDPVGATTVFGQSDTIHAVVAIANAPSNTQFKAAWYVVDIGDPSQANKMITSSQLSASGTRNLDFKLTPTNSWPVGTYRVDILVEGLVEYTATYSVK